MSKYAKLPTTPFKNIAFNAGTILTEFDPTSPTVDRSKIVGATTGGSSFNPNLDIINLFEDMDNAKANSKQGVYIRGCDPHLTTTLLTVGSGNIAKLMPKSTVTETAATSTTPGLTQIVPQDGIVPETDFFDIWIVTDYATMTEENGNTTAGFFAIHMIDCLNVNGFQQQTTKDGKVQYSCDFRAFYDVEDDDQTVPYEIYFSDGKTTGA